MTDPRPNPLAGVDCEVCRREPAVGVGAVPGVPYSAAFGEACLAAGASPLWVVVANTALAGGLQHAADWWIEEMVEPTLTHLGVSREDFDRQVAQAIAEFEQEETKQRAEAAANPREVTGRDDFPF